MISSIPPEELPENAYAYAENMEVRKGGKIETRRGSFRLYDDITGETVLGASIYRSPRQGERPETILVATEVTSSVAGKIYRMSPPTDREEMTLPGTLGNGPIRFVQGLKFIYIFRNAGLPVWRWSGRNIDAIEVVPDPVTGRPLTTTDRAWFFYQRFWMGSDVDTVTFSDLIDDEIALNFSTFDIASDGENLNALFPFTRGTIVVGKDRSIYLINNANNFADATELTMGDALSTTFGIIAQDTVVRPGDDVWFLSHKGVMSLRKNQEDNVRLVSTPISQPIQDQFELINWRYADKAQAIWFDNYYLLAVPYRESTVNNRIFVYDFLIGQWVSVFTGWEVQKFIVSNKDGRDVLYGVTSTGGVSQLLTEDRQDNVKKSDHWADFSGSTYSNVQTISCARNIFKQSTTSGYTSISFRVPTTVAGNQVIYKFDTEISSGFEILLDASDKISVRLDVGGATQWSLETVATNWRDGNWHSVTVFHDGVEPVIILDGTSPPQAFSVSVDKTAWGSAVNGVVDVDNLGWDDGVSTAFQGDIRFAKHFTGAQVLDQFVPFYEGSGNAFDLVDGGEMLFGTPTGYSPIWGGDAVTPGEITAILKTRGYTFGAGTVSDKGPATFECTFEHSNPTLKIEDMGVLPFDTATIEAAQTYDSTKYRDGSTDWVATNVNADHDTIEREDYVPPDLTSPFSIGASEAVCLGLMQRHANLYTMQGPRPFYQLQFTNSQGLVRFTSITEISEPNPAPSTRSFP